MRILYFTRADSVHDQRFMAALAGSGHETYVLRLYEGDYKTPEGVSPIAFKGIKGPLRLLQIPGLVARLKKLLEKLKPDLVHAGPLHDLAYLIAKTGYKPLLSMSWGFDLMRDVNVDAGMASRARFALANSSALITDARCSAQKAVELGFDENRICIFPWGVDIDKFSPQAVVTAGKRWREAQNWQDNTVLLCLRAMEANYGVDVLAKAFAIAAKNDPDLRLLLLGDGSQRSNIEKIFDEACVSEQVWFSGRVPNDTLGTYYGAADVYVTPSHVDGSSVSLMEAMACGLPSLVSDIPANLEWIRDGENGWVFPDNDPVKLAEIISKLKNDDWRAMAHQARQDAQEKANWNKNKQKLFDCYQFVHQLKDRGLA